MTQHQEASHPNPPTQTDHDLAIIGAGGAGLSCAHAMAQSGLRVLVLDRQFGFDGEKNKDTRTIALLHSSITFLQNMALWEGLQDSGEALKVMALRDRTGRFPQATDIHFDANELGLDAFGYNIPNAALVSQLAKAAQENDLITLQKTGSVQSLVQRNNFAEITTEEGDHYQVKLAIGADGAHSIVRAQAGIETNNWSYNQSAIACWFSHSTAHHNVSTEFHHKDGPLVIVPMKDNRCGLVWVEKPEEAQRLMTLSEEAFCRALEQQTEGLLGSITNSSVRSLFPLSGLTAKTFAQERVALIGHAAHVVPPIGAQGLNMGFRDSATLAEIIGAAHKHGEDIGSMTVLSRYDKARKMDVLGRTFAIDMMNRSLLSGSFPPIHLARGIGLSLLKNIAPLRQLVMRQGMGIDGDMPQLMRTAS